MTQVRKFFALTILCFGLAAAAPAHADMGVQDAACGIADMGMHAMAAQVQKLPDLDAGQIGQFVRDGIDDVKAKNWPMVFALSLALAVWVFRRFLADRFPALKTDRGGAITALALALAGGSITALSSGAVLTLDLFMGAIMTACTAAGGYTLIKKIVSPSDAK